MMNANGALLHVADGMRLIDEMLMRGVDLSLLRWRCGRAQRAAAFQFGLMLSTENSESGFALNSGSFLVRQWFCGIPMLVDDSMPPDELVLEALTPTDCIGIRGLAIPRPYECKVR